MWAGGYKFPSVHIAPKPRKFYLIQKLNVYHIQDVREISVIIITDDYLYYKQPKSSYNFFLVLIFNELYKFKTLDNGNIERRGALLWTLRTSTFSLRNHTDPFAFFTALPWLSDQKISM